MGTVTKKAKVKNYMTIAKNESVYKTQSNDELKKRVTRQENKLNEIHADTLASPFKLAEIAENYVKKEKLEIHLDVDYFLSEDLINQRRNRVTSVTGYMNSTLGLSYLISRKFSFKNIVNGLLYRTHLASLEQFKTGTDKHDAQDRIKICEQNANEISKGVRNLKEIETKESEYLTAKKQWLITRDELTKKVNKLNEKISEVELKHETAKAKGEGETRLKALKKIVDDKQKELLLLLKAQLENVEPTQPENQNFEVVESQFLIEGVKVWFVDNKNYINQLAKLFNSRKVLAAAKLVHELDKDKKSKFINAIFTPSILEGKTVLKLTAGQRLLLENLPLTVQQSDALKNSVETENKEFSELEGKAFIANNFNQPKAVHKPAKDAALTEKIEFLKFELEQLPTDSNTYKNKLGRLQKLESQQLV